MPRKKQNIIVPEYLWQTAHSSGYKNKQYEYRYTFDSSMLYHWRFRGIAKAPLRFPASLYFSYRFQERKEHSQRRVLDITFGDPRAELPFTVASIDPIRMLMRKLGHDSYGDAHVLASSSFGLACCKYCGRIFSAVAEPEPNTCYYTGLAIAATYRLNVNQGGDHEYLADEGYSLCRCCPGKVHFLGYNLLNYFPQNGGVS